MSVTFTSPVGPGLLLFAALSCALLLAVMWRGTQGAGSRRRRITLLALRGVVLLLVLTALAGPVFTWTPSTARERRPAVLVDTSLSMATRDAGNGATRIEKALALAHEITDACEADLYTVDSALRPLDPEARPQAKGKASELRKSILRLKKTRAVVLLSDGIETGPRAGAAPAVPVYAVGLGSDLGAVPNLGLRRVEYPEKLDLGTKGNVHVEVAASGPAAFLARAGKVDLRLLERGAERTVATLDLSKGGTRTVDFTVEPKAQGIARYELVLPERDEEATHLDNRRGILIEVTKPDFRVLYFSKRLDQEFRAIRREAGGMTGVRFTSLIELAPGRFSIQGDRPGDGLGRGLPDDPERLRRFHVIVLGAFPAAELAASKHAALRAYVEKGGGLVWMAAGDGFGRGGWNASPLAACSPLVFGANDPPPVARHLAVSIATESQRNPLALGLRPAIEGAAGPLAVDGLYRFGALLPGSEVILRATAPGGDSLPALACRDVERGRVVVLGGSTWFRWRTTAPQAYAALWRQILRYAASRSAERSRFFLRTDKPAYAPAETAVLLATVRDANLAPDPSAAVQGELLDLDGKRIRELAFGPSAGSPGDFTARVQLGGQGLVRVRATATGAKGAAETREVLLRVGGLAEGERVARDRDTLRMLAESSGGRLFEPAEAAQLIRLLKTPPEVELARISRSPFFDGPWGFLTIFLFALADWIVRRRMKLL